MWGRVRAEWQAGRTWLDAAAPRLLLPSRPIAEVHRGKRYIVPAWLVNVVCVQALLSLPAPAVRALLDAVDNQRGWTCFQFAVYYQLDTVIDVPQHLD